MFDISVENLLTHVFYCWFIAISRRTERKIKGLNPYCLTRNFPWCALSKRREEEEEVFESDSEGVLSSDWLNHTGEVIDCVCVCVTFDPCSLCSGGLKFCRWLLQQSATRRETSDISSVSLRRTTRTSDSRVRFAPSVQLFV